MDNNLTQQTKNAFDFIEKLYYEISYLIKEIEGILQQEDEEFIIIRPSGYGVTVKSSTGLESSNVAQWLAKNFTVCFCPTAYTTLNKGVTETKYFDNLKLLVIHIDIIGKDFEQPRITFGTIKDIQCKNEKCSAKFEKLMWEFSSNDEKIFRNYTDTKYEDSYCSFRRSLNFENLYSINDNSDIMGKIITPMLKEYRS